MDITQPNTTLQKGDLITICPECRHVVNYQPTDFRSKLIADNVTEIGLECPFCQHWTHSYYVNEALTIKALLVQKADRKTRREYTKEFKRFQKKMKARFKNEPA